MEESFNETGYKVVKGAIDPKKYYDHMQNLEKKGKLQKDPFSLYAFKDPMFEELLADFIPTIEKHAGCKVFKTYSFARQYQMGDVLPAHRDNRACEISVTICLGYEGRPWPIGIMNRDEIPQLITIEPGDLVMYKGIEMTHYRERNIYGKCSKLFLHYVDQNGPYAYCKDYSKVSFVRFIRVLQFLIRKKIRPLK